VTASVLLLPSLSEQADRLVALGVHELAAMSATQLRSLAAGQPGDAGGRLLVLHPEQVPASLLAPLLSLAGKPGFVVVDMTDLDEFTCIDDMALPTGSVYAVHEPDRGDQLANWTPNDALPRIRADGRSPLTIGEGLHWLIQRPELLERNHGFMTIGSRRRRKDGSFDNRTPAVWISNGTGRDGVHNRNAPKVGWCWAGNRHTWLGFASAAGRSPVA
jgi:hypothetical protein